MITTLTVPLSWYLIFTMMSLEIMLNAVALNFVAFARFMEPMRISGKTFAIIVYALAAAEAALGLALIISIWRTEDTVEIEQLDLLQG